MTDTTYILAVDPGNEKTGVAIVTPSGTMVCRKIIMTKQFNGEIERILTEYYGVVHMVCGNGTNHKYLYPSLQQIGRNHRITTSLIDESHSTEEARKLYWQYNPPTGWRKTAFVIGLRYTKQLNQIANDIQSNMMDSGELEEKRLHAMEQLYGKGEVHEK